jgi:hypothetical protein
MSMTEDPVIKSPRDRKAALRAQVQRSGDEVGLIFAADKVAKTRELRSLVAHDQSEDGLRPDEIIDKIEHYAASLQMLEELIPEHPLVRQLRFELEALDTYPPEGMSALAHSTLAHRLTSDAGLRTDTAA